MEVYKPSLSPIDAKINSSVLTYLREKRTPRLVQATMQDVYDYAMYKGETGVKIEVPPFDLPEDTLTRNIRDINGQNFRPMGLYFAPEFQGREGQELLLAALQGIGMIDHYINQSIPDDHEPTGWNVTEDTDRSPNLDKTPIQIRDFLAKQGRVIIGKNQDLTLAIFKKITTGRFPDEETVTYLSNGFGGDGGVADAGVSSRGCLGVLRDLGRGDHDPDWGARSMLVK